MTEAASTVTDVLGDLMNINTKPQASQKPNRQSCNTIPGTRVTAPTYLTSDQAAKYLNVAPRLLENWRWRKVGPKFVKVGNRIRYDMMDLKSFINSTTKPSQTHQKSN